MGLSKGRGAEAGEPTSLMQNPLMHARCRDVCRRSNAADNSHTAKHLRETFRREVFSHHVAEKQQIEVALRRKPW